MLRHWTRDPPLFRQRGGSSQPWLRKKIQRGSHGDCFGFGSLFPCSGAKNRAKTGPIITCNGQFDPSHPTGLVPTSGTLPVPSKVQLRYRAGRLAVTRHDSATSASLIRQPTAKAKVSIVARSRSRYPFRMSASISVSFSQLAHSESPTAGTAVTAHALGSRGAREGNHFYALRMKAVAGVSNVRTRDRSTSAPPR